MVIIKNFVPLPVKEEEQRLNNEQLRQIIQTLIQEVSRLEKEISNLKK